MILSIRDKGLHRLHDDDDPRGNPKVFLRTLLYSTAKRGRIVENMLVKLRRGESVQNFNFLPVSPRSPLYEYRHGEKLGTPLDSSVQNWLRNTEELFYSDSAPFLITNVSSHIRSDLRASRRNAYQRMFSMDINHGTADGKV